MNDTTREIGLILFDTEGIPQQVYALEPLPDGRCAYDEYQVDVSKRDGLCYELIGFGSTHPGEVEFHACNDYWVRDGLEQIVGEAHSPEDGYYLIDGKSVPFAPRRLLELPERWRNLEPDASGNYGIFAGMTESDTEYCAQCGDYFATAEHPSATLCPHIGWCWRCGGWSNPNEAALGSKLIKRRGCCCYCGLPWGVEGHDA